MTATPEEKEILITSDHFKDIPDKKYTRYSIFGDIPGLPRHLSKASLMKIEAEGIEDVKSFDLTLQYGEVSLKKEFTIKEGVIHPTPSVGGIHCDIVYDGSIVIGSHNRDRIEMINHHFVIFRDVATSHEIYPSSWRITLKVEENPPRGKWYCSIL